MGRPRPNRSKALKAMRREQAQQRQQARDERSPEQQLKLLSTRPGNATKERILLGKKVNS